MKTRSARASSINRRTSEFKLPAGEHRGKRRLMRAPNSIARIRNLVAILLAVVLLLAPTLTRAGMISAVQPHHAQMMEQTGHCDIPPSRSGDSDKSAGKNCCISTCLAITSDAAAPSDNQPLQRAALTVPVTIFRVGFLGEIATPPPRPL